MWETKKCFVVCFKTFDNIGFCLGIEKIICYPLSYKGKEESETFLKIMKNKERLKVTVRKT